MIENKNVKNMVAHSLIWASMMIATSLILQDSGKSFSLFLIMLSGWFATQSLIASPKELWRAECAMFRKLFGVGARR